MWHCMIQDSYVSIMRIFTSPTGYNPIGMYVPVDCVQMSNTTGLLLALLFATQVRISCNASTVGILTRDVLLIVWISSPTDMVPNFSAGRAVLESGFRLNASMITPIDVHNQAHYDKHIVIIIAYTIYITTISQYIPCTTPYTPFFWSLEPLEQPNRKPRPK